MDCAVAFAVASGAGHLVVFDDNLICHHVGGGRNASLCSFLVKAQRDMLQAQTPWWTAHHCTKAVLMAPGGQPATDSAPQEGAFLIFGACFGCLPEAWTGLSYSKTS